MKTRSVEMFDDFFRSAELLVMKKLKFRVWPTQGKFSMLRSSFNDFLICDWACENQPTEHKLHLLR